MGLHFETTQDQSDCKICSRLHSWLVADLQISKSSKPQTRALALLSQEESEQEDG